MYYINMSTVPIIFYYLFPEASIETELKFDLIYNFKYMLPV